MSWYYNNNNNNNNNNLLTHASSHKTCLQLQMSKINIDLKNMLISYIEFNHGKGVT